MLFDTDLELADQVITIPALGRRKAGPFMGGVYNDEYSHITVTYDDATDLTLGAFELTNIT